MNRSACLLALLLAVATIAACNVDDVTTSSSTGIETTEFDGGYPPPPIDDAGPPPPPVDDAGPPPPPPPTDCNSDEDCGPGYRCEWECPPCEDGDCPPTPCYSQCVPELNECYGDWDCPPGSVCNFQCVTVCELDGCWEECFGSCEPEDLCSLVDCPEGHCEVICTLCDDDTPVGNGDDDTPVGNGDDDTPVGNGDDDTPVGNGTDPTCGCEAVCVPDCSLPL